VYNKEAIYKWRNKNPKYFKKYNSTHRKQCQKYDLTTAKKRRTFINSLKNRPCTDCGDWLNPWQMDFDHKNPTNKLGHVSQIHSVQKLYIESKKCDLVCANCHREREHQRHLLSGGRYVQR